MLSKYLHGKNYNMGIRKNEPVLGIDISNDLIKVVELEAVSDTVKINGFSSAETPAGSVKNGIVVNPEAVGKIIAALAAQGNMRAKKAIASVRSPYAILRLSRLPFMSKEQAGVALQKEIDQYTIFKGRGSLFDLHIVEEISEEGIRKMNVLFAVTALDICDSYVKAVTGAGLELISLDMSTLSILRSLTRTNFKISGLEVTMLVAINPDSIDMCVLKGERIRFCHTVRVDTNQISSDIDGFVEKVASAFKLVLNFYQAKYSGGENISKLVLSCDSHSSLPVKEKLSQRLRDIPIEIGDPASYMSFDQNRIHVEKLGQLRAFSSAIGSAMQPEALSGYPVSFNLIPKERFQKLEWIKVFRTFNIILCVILGAFLVYLSSLFLKNMNLNRQVANIEREIKNPDPQLAKVNAIFEENYKIEAVLEDRLFLLNQIILGTVPWDRVAVSALAKAPEGLWFTKVQNVQDSTLNIRGLAKSEEPIFNYVKELENSFYFSSAKIVTSQNVKYEEAEAVEFMIVCTLKEDKK